MYMYGWFGKRIVGVLGKKRKNWGKYVWGIYGWQATPLGVLAGGYFAVVFPRG
jgi:hypothetical protein